jgi:6-phosphogluconolactonase/glucosamine-6-phosphate isomerase/deaminase
VFHALLYCGDAVNIEVLNDTESVAKRAAAIIAEEARQAVADRGAFMLGGSGGGTPWEMLRALAGMSLPWQSVYIFQTDERVALAGHADRNLTHIRESLKSAPHSAKSNPWDAGRVGGVGSGGRLLRRSAAVRDRGPARD